MGEYFCLEGIWGSISLWTEHVGVFLYEGDMVLIFLYEGYMRSFLFWKGYWEYSCKEGIFL